MLSACGHHPATPSAESARETRLSREPWRPQQTSLSPTSSVHTPLADAARAGRATKPRAHDCWCSRSASTGSSRARAPPQPGVQPGGDVQRSGGGQARRRRSSEAGAGRLARSETKVIKQSESFSLTLQVEEPSVLAFRWSSVTDGPPRQPRPWCTAHGPTHALSPRMLSLSLSPARSLSQARRARRGMASVDLAPQEAEAPYRAALTPTLTLTLTLTLT